MDGLIVVDMRVSCSSCAECASSMWQGPYVCLQLPEGCSVVCQGLLIWTDSRIEVAQLPHGSARCQAGPWYCCLVLDCCIAAAGRWVVASVHDCSTHVQYPELRIGCVIVSVRVCCVGYIAAAMKGAAIALCRPGLGKTPTMPAFATRGSVAG